MTHTFRLKRPLAVFDLETTGVDQVKDRIVEMSVAKALPDGTVVLNTWRINPTVPIPPETSAIHGIYDEDVRDAPPFKQVAREIARVLEGCDLAGFNHVRFDVPMLVEEFLRTDVPFDVSKRRLLDAARLFHLMEKRNLSAAYRFYCDGDISDIGRGAHSAEADTIATLRVLDGQLDRYDGQTAYDNLGKEQGTISRDVDAMHELLNDRMIDLANRMCYNDEGVAIINFGKHKHRPVLEVLEREPSFYDWVMRGDFPLDTKRKLTEFKLSLRR
ncbi:MAG: 3'-5' exonuclease [Catalinimonas sp.]